MGGISRGKEGDAGGMVRWDGSEGGAEVWVAFKIAEELDLVVSVCDGGGIVVCAKMDDFLSAVTPEGSVEEK